MVLFCFVWWGFCGFLGFFVCVQLFGKNAVLCNSMTFFFILLLLAKGESSNFCNLSIYLEHIRYHIFRIHLLLYGWSLSVLSIHFQMSVLSQQKVKNLTIFGLQNAKALSS